MDVVLEWAGLRGGLLSVREEDLARLDRLQKEKKMGQRVRDPRECLDMHSSESLVA